MIVSEIQGNIFATPCKYIAFAIKSGDGPASWGFPATVVRSTNWIALQRASCELGSVMQHDHADRTYVAIAAYTWVEYGWSKAPIILQSALDSLDIPESQNIAMILPGSGEGSQWGADPEANKMAIANSTKNVVLYAL